MSAETATCVVDGRAVRVRPTATIIDLKKAGNVAGNDSLVEVSHSAAESREDGEIVNPGARYRSIPPTTQG